MQQAPFESLHRLFAEPVLCDLPAERCCRSASADLRFRRDVDELRAAVPLEILELQAQARGACGIGIDEHNSHDGEATSSWEAHVEYTLLEEDEQLSAAEVGGLKPVASKVLNVHDGAVYLIRPSLIRRLKLEISISPLGCLPELVEVGRRCCMYVTCMLPHVLPCQRVAFPAYGVVRVHAGGCISR